MVVSTADLELLLPVTARTLAALMVLPVYSHRSIPAMVKIVLAIAIAWLLVISGAVHAQAPANLGLMLADIVAEVVLGLLLGFVGSLAFWTLGMAGELLTMTMGLSFPGSVHPSLETGSAGTAQFFTITGTLIFLTIGGHRTMLMAVASTFAAAPPYGVLFRTLQAEQALALVSSLFAAAVQLAFPVMATLMLTEAVLGFLSRVMPQLNAWVFGMPVKVAVGLLTLWICLPSIALMIGRMLSKAPLDLQLMVK